LFVALHDSRATGKFIGFAQDWVCSSFFLPQINFSRLSESLDIAIQELGAIKEVLYGRLSLDDLTKLFHLNSIMQDSEQHPLSPRSPTKTGNRIVSNSEPQSPSSSARSSQLPNISSSTDGDGVQ
jgi:hypothetical protein